MRERREEEGITVQAQKKTGIKQKMVTHGILEHTHSHMMLNLLICAFKLYLVTVRNLASGIELHDFQSHTLLYMS